MQTKNGIGARWIAVSRLKVDPNYQRALKPKHKTYVRKWDWRAAGAILVARRGKELYIVDGFQRLSAAKLAGHNEMFCVVIECSGVKDEAEVFIKCNVERSQMAPLDKFWAGVIAGGKEYVSTLAEVERSGFQIKKPGEKAKPDTAGTISSVGKLMLAFHRGVLRETLEVCAAAVAKENRSKLLSGFFLGGLQELIYRCPQVDLDRLSKRIRLADLDVVQAHAKSQSNRGKAMGLGGGGTRYFAAAIADFYNKGLAVKNKLQYEIKDAVDEAA